MFSSHTKLRKEEIPDTSATTTRAAEIPSNLPKSEDIGLGQDVKAATNDPAVRITPDEDLPSHQVGKRWRLSQRFYQIMDDLMPKLATASQRINNYTGTDYSGIEALRSEIREQEKLVRARAEAVKTAKEALETARARESVSRKEVVGLLERKHAWSDADLERYMTLIRSEHLNDQGVQAAKDNVAAAERALEEARTRLEKRERMQYHEEQIWSDTIRRNSTWVTFGLMGLNIFLLLATMVIIEPWRRKRLVKEIRRTLEEKHSALVEIPLITEQNQVNESVEPKGVPLETSEAPAVETHSTEDIIADLPLRIEEKLDITPVLAEAAELAFEARPSPPVPTVVLSSAEHWKQYVQDLFSAQEIVVRKVDVTTIALQGAAMGAAVVGLLLVFLRPQ